MAVTAAVVQQEADSVLGARVSSIASAPSHVAQRTAILCATPATHARIVTTTVTMIAIVAPTMAMTVAVMTTIISALSPRATAPLYTPGDAGSTETTK